ncbi:uncharacterized protein VTP21DRAFT_10 [Calcarisporiella thermophila]|uniref:uncharacterized protein n=1 Tax=Calcarisporiella thermophila TaxID=911321 RepID=UPI00374301F0
MSQYTNATSITPGLPNVTTPPRASQTHYSYSPNSDSQSPQKTPFSRSITNSPPVHRDSPSNISLTSSNDDRSNPIQHLNAGRRISLASLPFGSTTSLHSSSYGASILNESALRLRVEKTAAELPSLLKQVLNDATINLYRVTELVHHRVPALVEEKNDLKALNTKLDFATADIADAQRTVDMWQQLDEFDRVNEMILTVKKRLKAK